MSSSLMLIINQSLRMRKQLHKCLYNKNRSLNKYWLNIEVNKKKSHLSHPFLMFHIMTRSKERFIKNWNNRRKIYMKIISSMDWNNNHPPQKINKYNNSNNHLPFKSLRLNKKLRKLIPKCLKDCTDRIWSQSCYLIQSQKYFYQSLNAI